MFACLQVRNVRILTIIIGFPAWPELGFHSLAQWNISLSQGIILFPDRFCSTWMLIDWSWQSVLPLKMQNVGKDFFHICRFVWPTHKLNMGSEFSKLVLHWQCTPIQTVTCKAYCLLYLILLPKIASNFWKLMSLKDCSTSLKISFNIRMTTDELMHQRRVYELMHKKFKEKANE